MARKRRRSVKRKRRSSTTLTDRKVRTLIRASRRLLSQRTKMSPQHHAKLRRLAACTSGREGRQVIQRGGLFPLIPLLIAAAPVIAKAALGAGVSMAAGAAGAAIKNAINKKK